MGRAERALSALVVLMLLLTLGAGAALLFQLSRGLPVEIETAPSYGDSAISDDT